MYAETLFMLIALGTAVCFTVTIMKLRSLRARAVLFVIIGLASAYTAGLYTAAKGYDVLVPIFITLFVLIPAHVGASVGLVIRYVRGAKTPSDVEIR